MATREHVYRLVDELPDDDLEAVEHFLERLNAASDDPFERALLRAAVLEPEALSPEDEEALAEADADIAAGRMISHEEVVRRVQDAVD